MPEKILVVDDEEINLMLLDKVLRSWNFNVVLTSSGQEAFELIQSAIGGFEIALVDLKMPGLDGIQVLEELKKIDPEIFVIIMTAFGSIETAIQAVKKGALDYVTKPLDIEHLRIIIDRALQERKTKREVENLRSYAEQQESFGNIIGSTASMKKVYQLIKKVSKGDASVLILGETGTGKELVARAIHLNSPRHNEKFVTLSCGALPETLIESELFGYEQGAFTGATKRKIGLIEYAHRGTIFMDEIADIPMGTQMKLLRVLQEKEFNRLGSPEPIRVNIRLISATNKNLQKEIEKGSFREDLFYRINVVTIDLPPLRERKNDIPILAQHFLARFNAQKDQKIKDISLPAMILLIQYHWPGNVRELENTIERAISLDTDGIISPEDLPDNIANKSLILTQTPADADLPLKKVLEDVEKNYLIEILKAVKGNVSQAINKSGLSHATFYEKLKRHQIDPSELRRDRDSELRRDRDSELRRDRDSELRRDRDSEHRP